MLIKPFDWQRLSNTTYINKGLLRKKYIYIILHLLSSIADIQQSRIVFHFSLITLEKKLFIFHKISKILVDNSSEILYKNIVHYYIISHFKNNVNILATSSVIEYRHFIFSSLKTTCKILDILALLTTICQRNKEIHSDQNRC